MPLLFYCPEDQRLRNSLLSFQPNGMQRCPVFKKRDRRPPHVCVTDFEIVAAPCCHKNPREVLRMIPNGDRPPRLAPGDENRMPITNMEERQSVSLDFPLHYGQKPNQEPELSVAGSGKLPRIKAKGKHPPRVSWRRSKQPAMRNVVVASGDLDREPLLEFSKRQRGRLFRLSRLPSFGRRSSRPR
ncbi:hypothetical protein F01_560040 [Burkholderia cenocepacia]|nr:hypothetical protein F01_560040 [Burkholderia cenocepacia]